MKIGCTSFILMLFVGTCCTFLHAGWLDFSHGQELAQSVFTELNREMPNGFDVVLIVGDRLGDIGRVEHSLTANLIDHVSISKYVSWQPTGIAYNLIIFAPHLRGSGEQVSTVLNKYTNALAQGGIFIYAEADDEACANRCCFKLAQWMCGCFKPEIAKRAEFLQRWSRTFKVRRVMKIKGEGNVYFYTK